MGWGTVRSCLFRHKKSSVLGWRTVQSCLFGGISIVSKNVIIEFLLRNSMLGWGTVQSCLFRDNNAEFSVGMGNGSVLPFSI